jgi:predicted nucleotidyltransferase
MHAPYNFIPPCPGRMLVWKVWGSHSHGTQTPASDIDYCGVYVLPTSKILGIYPPEDSIVGEKPDFQLHEAGKFCQLLLKGNPGIVEILFTEKLFERTGEWEMLRHYRRRFLSKKTVANYIGYAEGQLQKIVKGTSVHTKGGEPSEKWAYHLARLLNDSARILNGGEPEVWKSGAELERLMKIRRGDILPMRVVDDCKTEIFRQREHLKVSNLPEESDQAYLEEWLLKLRKANL